MKARSFTHFLMVIMVLLLAMPASGANVVEKLMMPGELSSAHIKLEEDCANCHKTLEKEAQSDLCMDCHKPVKHDISQKRGFHGKDMIVGKSECFTCHVEHRGRETRIINLEPITFNHDHTEYPLEGRHASATCSSCHIEGKKFREAPHGCLDCHKTDEPHRGELGDDCAKCHTSENWRTLATIFDHTKTRFPLTGKHRQQPCISCHLGEVYKNLPMTCNDCHAIQDVHAT
ncbi:MAG: cytochrome c3 family protein, partial [Aestuariivirga sp.]